MQEPSNANRQAQRPEFEILTQFIKDLSFESPSTPSVFFEKMQTTPSLNVNLEVKTQKIGDELYEVALGVKVNNTAADKPLFVIDLTYGLVAAVRSKDEEAIKEYLTKTAPAHAFPFVRAIIADLTRESGFSPFVLAPIDFSKVEFAPPAPPTRQEPANKG
jgi:preprotein translocase subunit SecB